MSVDSKLTAIADAIRGKTGESGTLTLDAMAEAIAAIETGGGGGDADTLNAMIDRSITEISSDVTSIGQYVFNGCSALTTADFPLVTSIGNYAFRYCSALTALILHSETMATLSNVNALTGTPIASGTGYVYVPDSLVDSYKAATNWATYADQIKPLSEYAG